MTNELSIEINWDTAIIDGIDTKDYPDFCDAYISYVECVDGIEVTDERYDIINNNSDLISELVYQKLF